MSGLLSMCQVLKELGEVYKKKKKCLPQSFIENARNMAEQAKLSEEGTVVLDQKVSKWIEEKKVKASEVPIPPGVLGDGLEGILRDIKVHAHHGPDDKVYAENADIQKMIPRGVTTLKLSGTEEWFDTVLYANKKFTGGIGDEDEDQPTDNEAWKSYCLASPDTSKSIVCMEKMNGEAAHFSGRFIGDQFFLITGSKNVHMLIRRKEDIDLYEGDRYLVAKQVAKSVWDAINCLNEQNQQLLKSFLHHTKCTAVCELLQPISPHIVDLSHLKEPQLTVITFTSTMSDGSVTSLTALPPHHTLDVLVALGFTCPAYEVIQPETLSDHQKEVKLRLGTEGEVIYFLNAEEETIGLVKVKSTWYVLLRALREKAVYCFTTAKKKPDWSLDHMVASTHRRFSEIQDWLNFPDDYLEKWKTLGKGFLNWLQEELNKEGGLLKGEIRSSFPQLWESFLKETQQTDKFTP